MQDREEISRGLSQDWTFTHIAHNISRPVSTVSDEVKKNCMLKRCYRAAKAQGKADLIKVRQKQSKKLDQEGPLKDYVVGHLRLEWSPDEIAKRLKVDYATDTTMRISHESIYTYIYCLPRGELKKELMKGLRQERKFRHNRKAIHAQRGVIQDFISISERPAETLSRTIPGHWEGDLIVGKDGLSAIGTLVERMTRYLLIVPLDKKDAGSVRLAFAKAVKNIPRRLKKTLTYDRGSEMAEHKLFLKETKIQVYFCDPHSPWQRGTNENTNGLIRQYFPKGTDFTQVTKKELQRAQDRLNGRPRRVLAYAKPDEMFIPLLTNKDFVLGG